MFLVKSLYSDIFCVEQNNGIQWKPLHQPAILPHRIKPCAWCEKTDKFLQLPFYNLNIKIVNLVLRVIIK